MTASESLADLNRQLTSALLRKERLASELDSLNATIKALSNVLEGVRLGGDVIREGAEAAAAKAAAAAPADPIPELVP